MTVIGRKQEKAEMDRAIASQNPELVVVCGRRRVRKTHLVREHLRDHIAFEIIGMHDEHSESTMKNNS